MMDIFIDPEILQNKLAVFVGQLGWPLQYGDCVWERMFSDPFAVGVS